MPKKGSVHGIPRTKPKVIEVCAQLVPLIAHVFPPRELQADPVDRTTELGEISFRHREHHDAGPALFEDRRGSLVDVDVMAEFVQ
jgi:hypothetical protein